MKRYGDERRKREWRGLLAGVALAGSGNAGAVCEGRPHRAVRGGEVYGREVKKGVKGLTMQDRKNYRYRIGID